MDAWMDGRMYGDIRLYACVYACMHVPFYVRNLYVFICMHAWMRVKSETKTSQTRVQLVASHDSSAHPSGTDLGILGALLFGRINTLSTGRGEWSWLRVKAQCLSVQ